MICIVGSRRSGKTTALIELSAITGVPIYAPRHAMAVHIAQQAKDMGVSIPDPIRFGDDTVRGKRKVLIDELGPILQRYFGIEVVCATIDAQTVDLSSMTLLELLRAWWGMRKVPNGGKS